MVATIFEAVPVEVAMCVARHRGFFIGIPAARNTMASARGLDKIRSPRRSVYCNPARRLRRAASLSIAIGIAVRWSGLLFGSMMFLFVAMIHLRGALARPHDRFIWTIVVRETSFGGAGWILAGTAMDGWRTKGKSALVDAGRVCVFLA